MNDTDELALGQKRLQTAIGTKRTHPACKLMTRLMEHPGYVSGLLFATSFTEQRDLLSQWRAYADNGAGFALGFNVTGFGGLTLDGKDVDLHMVRVEYDPSKHEELAERLVDATLDIVAKLASEGLDHQDDQSLTFVLGMDSLEIRCDLQELRFLRRTGTSTHLAPASGLLSATRCRTAASCTAVQLS